MHEQSKGSEKLPIFGGKKWQRRRKAEKAKDVDMTEEEQEIILSHLLDGE